MTPDYDPRDAQIAELKQMIVALREENQRILIGQGAEYRAALESLPQAPLAQVGDRDDNRCGVCAWPLAMKPEDGCTRGNCAERPVRHLSKWYDPVRYAREQQPTPPALPANGTKENES